MVLSLNIYTVTLNYIFIFESESKSAYCKQFAIVK